MCIHTENVRLRMYYMSLLGGRMQEGLELFSTGEGFDLSVWTGAAHAFVFGAFFFGCLL